MSAKLKKLASVEDFYAHAIGLEHEFEERLTDLTSCLRAHHNADSAKVFAKARVMHLVRVRHLEALSSSLELPAIAPWDYVWHYTVNLEIICITSVHYLMTPLEALEMVEEKLQGAHEFYQSVADRFQGNGVGDAAAQVLSEFEKELEQFRQWHSDLEHKIVYEDHDPPNEPI